MRKVNQPTLELIKKSEGLRLTAYPDPGSKNGVPWTIGYGSTKGVTKGMKISAEEAEARLRDDLTHAENTVSRLVTMPLNDNQFGALVSFVFNIGAGAFEQSTLLSVLNQGKYEAVPAQLARWNKNDGSVMAGLTKRRAEEAKLWNTPSKQTTFDGGGNEGIIPPEAPIIVAEPEYEPAKRFNIWPWVLGAVILAVLFVVTQVRF